MGESDAQTKQAARLKATAIQMAERLGEVPDDDLDTNVEAALDEAYFALLDLKQSCSHYLELEALTDGK